MSARLLSAAAQHRSSEVVEDGLVRHDQPSSEEGQTNSFKVNILGNWTDLFIFSLEKLLTIMYINSYYILLRILVIKGNTVTHSIV